MKKTSALELVAKPEGFFRDLVTKALGSHRLNPRPETEFYLVNLLTKFITTDRLYTQDGDGSFRQEPLALLVKQALESPEPQAQSALFRHVGDVSLYMAGFFHESLHRKSVDVEYYIDMGGTAYAQVAARTSPVPQRVVYEELSDKFGTFVDVFAEVSETTSPKTEQDLLRLYELWTKTKSERAAKALQAAGIFPTEAGARKKEVQ